MVATGEVVTGAEVVVTASVVVVSPPDVVVAVVVDSPVSETLTISLLST